MALTPEDKKRYHARGEERPELTFWTLTPDGRLRRVRVKGPLVQCLWHCELPPQWRMRAIPLSDLEARPCR